MIKISKTKIVDTERYINGVYKGIHKWKKYELDANKHFKLGNLTEYSFGSGYEVFRDELINDQGAKCCYCEKPVSNGQIEHYRPKGAYQQVIAGPKISPGYYFLVYRWENLLISCAECNASGQKGILFPINSANRATNLSTLRHEDPIIINPCYDNPEDHITFKRDVPVSLTDRGKLNIEIFKLVNRGDIKSIREDRFLVYTTNKQILALGIMDKLGSIEIKKILKNATKSKQPFSGMIRANLKSGKI